VEKDSKNPCLESLWLLLPVVNRVKVKHLLLDIDKVYTSVCVRVFDSR
jgi:hypothetical protein